MKFSETLGVFREKCNQTSISSDPEKILSILNGRRIGLYTLKIGKIYRPTAREKECRYFDLHLMGKDGQTPPVISGLFSAGRKSINLRSYFDIDFYPNIQNKGGEKIDFHKGRVDREIFGVLSELVEPGGKIIIAVASMHDPKLHGETFRRLDIGIPPEATYLGGLLFACGCGSGFKSWLIREGGREGSPALQGDKATDNETRVKNIHRTIEILEQFIATEEGDGMEAAETLLEEIRVGKIPKR